MLDVPGFVFDVRGLVGVLPRIRREKQYPGAKRQDGGCQRDGGRPTFTQRFQIVLEARAKRDVNFIEATLYRVGEVFERRAYYHGAKMATKRRVFVQNDFAVAAAGEMARDLLHFMGFEFAVLENPEQGRYLATIGHASTVPVNP